MGFFDRLLGKKGGSPAPRPSAEAQPASKPAPQPEASADVPTADLGPIAPRLDEAFEQLELRNLEGAQTIYTEILASPAGSRPDVLVRISGDLGATGHVAAIPELIAPLYDAERHGPATGINLLQAYLALRNPQAAQHVLDLLFALQKPELEERLWGFSNAIGELMESDRHGPAAAEATSVNLVTISKPIWTYGIEDLPDLLPPPNPKAKTVAFAQLTLPDHDNTDELSQQPEEALGRLTRGLPLWLADSLYFSPQYTTLGVAGVIGQQHYMAFPAAWTTDNIRQLIETSGSSIDYVMTGELREQDGDYRLALRLWEIKGFRERKTFEATWTPANADTVLADLHQQIRFFFECREGPGLPYQEPAQPTVWIDTLAASLTTFLVDKGVLPPDQFAGLPDTLADPATGDTAALARLTLAHRCTAIGVSAEAPNLPEGDLIRQAQAALA
jgi:hypothetical protein